MKLWKLLAYTGLLILAMWLTYELASLFQPFALEAQQEVCGN